MEIYKKLKKFGKVKINEPIFKHTTIKIGGIADFFIFIDSAEKLVGLLNFLNAEGVNYIVIGGGSNTLLSGERFEGVIISTIRNDNLRIEGDLVIAESGCPTVKIAQESIKNNLTGFEWGVGVPGTIGGAISGNAGAMGVDMKDSVEKVEVYRDGEVIELSKEDCEFGYRNSIFKHNNDIILRVNLRLKQGEWRSQRGCPGVKSDSKDLVKKAMNHITHRNKTQPQGFPSSGCILKNVKLEEEHKKIPNLPKEFVEKGFISAGWLIDQAGLKGETVGKAQVSDAHCNFIINLGGATEQDIISLIEKIKEKVYDKFGIKLEEEVRIVNF